MELPTFLGVGANCRDVGYVHGAGDGDSVNYYGDEWYN
jgi:hypothetical protein